jgi:uncharacterized protein (DUF608 family)
VPPTSDGQLATILRVYRHWQLSGDDDWLQQGWAQFRHSLDYALTTWDRDADGLLEAPHHHTYDGTFISPEPQSQTLYLAALRAGEQMARHLGDSVAAGRYRKLFENGSALADEKLFNGEYYRQWLGPDQSDVHQLGNGCLIDQLVGQWHATNLGLGYLLKPDHVRSALESIFRHNFQADGYRNWINRYRAFALNDEQGTVVCSWPNDDRPSQPFLYADETMCGFEYQFAALLIQEGLVEKGLAVAAAVRDRFDGHKRNPWNEFECGNHYARSMASYGLLLAISGLQYSAVDGVMGFAPKYQSDHFRCPWAVPGAWGEYESGRRKKRWRETLTVKAGRLKLRAWQGNPLQAEVTLGEKSIHCQNVSGRLVFDRPVIVTTAHPLQVTSHLERTNP